MHNDHVCGCGHMTYITIMFVGVVTFCRDMFTDYIFPHFLGDPKWQLIYVLFWGVIVCTVLLYVYKNGPHFVNHPRLVNRPDHKKHN